MNSCNCELRNAKAYLEGELSPVQEREYLELLDSCPGCREHLEMVAVGDQDIGDFRRFLASGSRTDFHAFNSQDLPADESGKNAADLPFLVQQIVDSLQPTDSPDSMGRIDNFEIKGVVGSGAMGVVLKAKDASLDRIVALKVMTPSLAASGTARSRFEREAKAAAAVHHPNVVAIHGVQTAAKLPYLVMPYLKGNSLHRRVQTQGPLSVPEVLRVGSQIAAGLAAAHRQGVVHRDIKPSNIMLDDGVEAAIITDFGLARIVDEATMTRTGVISGTPEFMSPEQARGELTDSQSDLFSLGSLLYMLCTGYPPFRAETSFGVLRRITDDTPKPIRQLNPEIPTWLCTIVEELQQKDPQDRPSAAEAQSTLEACLAHVYQPEQALLPERFREVSPRSRPVNFRFVLLGTIAMIATLTLFALAFLNEGNDDSSTKSKHSPTGLMPTTIEAEGSQDRVYKTMKLSFPDEKKRGKLIVDINRGFIDVKTHKSPEVIVEVLYPPKAKNRTQPGALPQQFSPSYDLYRKKESNSIKIDTYNQDYPLNLRIKVPEMVDLDLDNYLDGYLRVEGVSGKIRANSQHSDITLKNISGSAEGSSYNGHIVVSFRTLAVDARLDFESYNGSIDVSLPENASLTTAIYAGRGTFGSIFELTAPSPDDMELSWLRELSKTEYSVGLINGGGIPLRIECAKGKVSLRKSKGH
ncbi:MAG TPA: hypothetical protein DDW52_23705 [Planctomycetaceae bacterium]|nr:hypothetical protein [Planctomycetaceae bacterium]